MKRSTTSSRHLADIAVHAPLVMAQRLARFAGPVTPVTEREWQRMFDEKRHAWTLGAWHAAWTWWTWPMQLGFSVWQQMITGRPSARAALSQLERATAAGLAPTASIVKRNARRLGRMR